MPATPIRNIRVDDETWKDAQRALDAVEGTRRVVVVLRPGMTRTGALVAFLRALTRTTS